MFDELSRGRREPTEAELNDAIRRAYEVGLYRKDFELLDDGRLIPRTIELGSD